QFGLLPRRAELLALPEIGGERHDLAAVGGLQPAQDHACVQATGIGENDFLHILDAHWDPSWPMGGGNALAGRGARSGIPEPRPVWAVVPAGNRRGFVVTDPNSGSKD